MGELIHNFTSFKWKPILSFTLLNVVMLIFAVLNTCNKSIGRLVCLEITFLAVSELISCRSAIRSGDSLFVSLVFSKAFSEKQGRQIVWINVNKCKRWQNFHTNGFEELLIMFKEILSTYEYTLSLGIVKLKWFDQASWKGKFTMSQPIRPDKWKPISWWPIQVFSQLWQKHETDKQGKWQKSNQFF